MIYIDNSATTKQYPQVTETMMKYMEEYFGNPSSMYQLGLDSEKAGCGILPHPFSELL